LVYGAFIFAGLAVAVILLLIARSIHPAPPRTVRLATGAAGGAYAATGELLARRLAVDGVTLELVPTTGSVQNLAELQAVEGGVDAAIIQGGVGAELSESAHLQSLGALFFEPLWVFTRQGVVLDDLRDLHGRRVAVGPEGSGVRALAEILLAENGVGPNDAERAPLGGAEAAAALTSGQVDAAIFVTSQETGYVKSLLYDEGVQLLSFDRAEAYARRHRYLSAVTLPRGVVDLAVDVPKADVSLIAPAAALVVREDLHPAIQSLLIQAAFETYRRGDALSAPGRFPSRDLVSFPLSEEAGRYYDRGGPSFLRRYLPFWAANLVERLWVLAIPAATLLYPLAKSAPPIYKWRTENRIHRWYKELRRLEAEGRRATDPATAARVRAELRRILNEVGDIKVPLSYSDHVYRLRSHIRLVEQIVSDATDGGYVGAV
jgi:TRAP transporter TAXI family solute receptor